MSKDKILIQDFIAELKKINTDLEYITLCVESFTDGYTKYIRIDHAIIIVDKLLAETTATELDVESFNRGMGRLIRHESCKPRYDEGVTYVTASYYGGY